jgi:putative addiction module component (TIGR02574 family)
MDLDGVLREVESWPVEERLQLVEVVWERIIEAGVEPDLTETQKAELDRRLAALDADPDAVVTWETVQEHLNRLP